MAQQETIKEFVAALGFKIDESQWSRFERGMTSATLKARLLGDAMEAMARTIVEKVVQAADQFEQLFYQTQRIGAAAGSIRAFAYAVSQMGGTVAGANASLQAFGDFMRSTPGAERLIQGLGVATRDAQGRAIDRGQLLLDIGKRLGDISKQGPAGVGLVNDWARRLNIDQDTLLAIERPEVRARYRQELASSKSAGIGDDLTAQAAKFEQTWRELWQRLGNMSDAGTVKLADGLTEPLKKFNKWLDDNQPALNSAIDKVTKALDGLAISWADDLAKIALGDDQTKGINSAADAITHFIDSLKPLIRELNEFNERSKNWWFIKLIDSAASGNMVKPLPDGPGFFASHGPGVDAGGLWGGVKGWWGRHAPGWLGGDGAGIRARAVGGEAQGNEKALAQSGYDYLRGQGLSHDAALAVLGNARGENPLGSLRVGDNGTAFGQFQWHPDRVADIFRNTGIDVRTASFADQLKAFRWEAEHGAGGGHIWEALKHAKSREEAIAILVHWYERSANQRGDAAIRLGYADRYGRSITGPTVAVKPRAPSGGAHAATLDWSTSAPGWAAINAALPVGAAGAPSSVKTDNRQANVTNTVHVVAPDPHTAAAMVGAHLDRTSADVQRNLAGSAQ